MGNNGWLQALAAIVGIGAGIVAIAEFFAPRCPICSNKLVIVNNVYYCNRCQTYVSPRISHGV